MVVTDTAQIQFCQVPLEQSTSVLYWNNLLLRDSVIPCHCFRVSFYKEFMDYISILFPKHMFTVTLSQQWGSIAIWQALSGARLRQWASGPEEHVGKMEGSNFFHVNLDNVVATFTLHLWRQEKDGNIGCFDLVCVSGGIKKENET